MSSTTSVLKILSSHECNDEKIAMSSMTTVVILNTTVAYEVHRQQVAALKEDVNSVPAESEPLACNGKPEEPEATHCPQCGYD